jgi:hypothetical protein
MDPKVVLSGRKDDQVRSYVEPDLRRLIDEYSSERGMTASQGMRKLIIEGLRKEGFEIAIAA